MIDRETPDRRMRPQCSALQARAVFSLVLLMLAGSLSCDRPYRGPARHVILISLDTTRPDQLGLYGNPDVRTPHLDRLAGRSIVFDDLLTAAPTTLASHVSLFTGKYPHNHGTPRNGFTVNDANVTLAETLSDHGFRTAGFAASFALDGRFGIDQGFDTWDDRFESFTGESDVLQNERSAEAVTDAVLAHLDEAGIPGNLHLFVHYFDPHAPYAPPPPYDTMYDPRGGEGLPDWADAPRKPGLRTDIGERMALQYAGEISYMDRHIGRLLEGLDARGVLDEALVVVTSDHGENFWEHARCFDHGWSTFQTTMRAVGIVRLPGDVGAGTRVTGVVSTVDLVPSVLSYLQIELPRGIDGEALDLTAGGGLAEDRVRFGEATKPWSEVETDPRWKNALKERCIRQGRYKFVQIPYQERETLYDLEQDPGERRDLLADPGIDPPDAQRIDDLRGRLEAWADSADPLDSNFVTSQQEETIERLKSLGYMGGQ